MNRSAKWPLAYATLVCSAAIAAVLVTYAGYPYVALVDATCGGIIIGLGMWRYDIEKNQRAIDAQSDAIIADIRKMEAETFALIRDLGAADAEQPRLH